MAETPEVTWTLRALERPWSRESLGSYAFFSFWEPEGVQAGPKLSSSCCSLVAVRFPLSPLRSHSLATPLPPHSLSHSYKQHACQYLVPEVKHGLHRSVVEVHGKPPLALYYKKTVKSQTCTSGRKKCVKSEFRARTRTELT